MSTIKRASALLLMIALLATPALSQAQDGDAKDAAAKKADAKDEKKDDASSEKKDDEAKDDEEEEEERESSDGGYEWKFNYGGGLEAGAFFTRLARWNSKFLDPQFNDGAALPQLETEAVFNIDLAVEISPIERTRFTIFGGASSPLTSNPSLSSLYLGVEPAFAFRREMWEMALGFGLGFGSADLSLESGETAAAGLVIMRPFLELRRYFSTSFAVYGRAGFNYWLTHSLETNGLNSSPNPLEGAGGSTNLNEGGVYLALGTRFGSYPEPIKRVPDSDEDGLKDDIDDCPEEAEDIDGFEDSDGCPELDNDKDGIPDAKDQCKDVPEDKDGWQDDDGCPEDNDDADGDGILNKDDKCVDKKEDKDGFEDEDGCPDLDDDKDGVPDTLDKCPRKAGVPEKQGCPFKRIELTLKKIVIREKIFFDLGKATIKEQSFNLLDELSQVMKDNPQIKKVEIQGHTDTKGTKKKNLKLSKDRAKSVYDYMVGKGVPAARLTSKGYGFSQPLVPTPKGEKETDEAAEKNRRVEFIILEQDEVKKTVREDKVKDVKNVDKTKEKKEVK